MLWQTVILVLFFFFSSRRRHTRYWRDWSSDVCSSDLQACRLPQGRRWTGGTGAREHGGGSVLGCGLCVPRETGGPDQAGVLGRHGSVPVRQATGGWHLPLAEGRRRRDPFVGRAIVGAA